MKNFLKKRVLGQDHIAETVADYIEDGELRLAGDTHPLSCFLFLGPTGTGKTETALAVADYLKAPLLRFNMSEYRAPEKWLRQFCETLGRNDHGVILLDEIEKGSLDIFDYFLQILEPATIACDGREYSTANYHIIMTSNIGSREIAAQPNFFVARQMVMRKVKATFRIEFLARIGADCQLCFAPLSYDIMRAIAAQKIMLFVEQLKQQGYALTVSDAVVPFLMTEGITPELGARAMVKTTQRHIIGAIKRAGGKKKGRLEVVAGDHIELL